MTDLYNWQLHPNEKQKLAQLQKGETPEEQQRLPDAACYLVQCAAQLSDTLEHFRLYPAMPKKSIDSPGKVVRMSDNSLDEPIPLTSARSTTDATTQRGCN